MKSLVSACEALLRAAEPTIRLPPCQGLTWMPDGGPLDSSQPHPSSDPHAGNAVFKASWSEAEDTARLARVSRPGRRGSAGSLSRASLMETALALDAQAMRCRVRRRSSHGSEGREESDEETGDGLSPALGQAGIALPPQEEGSSKAEKTVNMTTFLPEQRLARLQPTDASWLLSSPSFPRPRIEGEMTGALIVYSVCLSEISTRFVEWSTLCSSLQRGREESSTHGNKRF